MRVMFANWFPMQFSAIGSKPSQTTITAALLASSKAVGQALYSILILFDEDTWPLPHLSKRGSIVIGPADDRLDPQLFERLSHEMDPRVSSHA